MDLCWHSVGLKQNRYILNIELIWRHNENSGEKTVRPDNPTNSGYVLYWAISKNKSGVCRF